MDFHSLEKAVSINGLKVSYFDTLSGSESLLLLHGWGLSKAAYWRTIECIAPSFRVIAPDLPSFGKSGKPPRTWSYDDYAETLSKLVELTVGGPLTVVGHSFGGGVAITLASSRPELVKALVLVDTACIPLHTSLAVISVKKVTEVALQGLSRSRVWPTISISLAFARNLVFNFGPMWKAFELPNRIDLRGKIKTLSMPIILMWAERDMIVPISHGEQLSALVKVDLIMSPPKLYHDWCITNPTQFRDLLIHQIRNLDTSFT